MKAKPGKQFSLKFLILRFNGMPRIFMLKSCPCRLISGLKPSYFTLTSFETFHEVSNHWFQLKLV